MTTPDGRVWYKRSYPIRDKHGEVTGVVEAALDITERKRVEEELKESEAKYRTLTKNLNVGVYRNTPGPKGRYIEVNPALFKMFGYSSKEEVMVMNVSDFYQNPNDRKSFNKKILRDGFVKNEELKLKRKDGTPIVASDSAVAVKDENDKVAYYDGIIEDITERKKTEEDLKESEDKYRSLVENTKDSIILVDLDGNVQFANKATEELTGYSMEDGISMNVKDVTPLKYWPKSLLMLRKAGKGEAVPYFKSITRKKDGTLVPVESGGQAIIKEGKVTGVQIITRDITERRKAEELLKESESRFRRLVENSVDGITMVDETGNIVEWNTAQEHIIGRKRDEVLDRPIWDIDLQVLLADEQTTVTREQLKDGFLKVSRTGQAPWLDKPRELEIERPDGTRRSIQSVSYSIAARNGWMTGIITRDLTEQKRRERALRETQERYRELVEKAGVAILIDNEEGDILYFNYRFAELHGYTTEEMKEQPLDSLVHADDVEMVRRYHRQRMKGLSAPSRYEFKGLKKDGSVVYLEVDAVVLEEGDRTHFPQISSALFSNLSLYPIITYASRP